MVLKMYLEYTGVVSHVDIKGWIDEFMSIYVNKVNPICHCLWIAFGTIFMIPLRFLSCLWRIEFWIPFRGLSVFWVNLGLIFPAHPLPFQFSDIFSFLFILLFFLISWSHSYVVLQLVAFCYIIRHVFVSFSP